MHIEMVWMVFEITLKIQFPPSVDDVAYGVCGGCFWVLLFSDVVVHPVGCSHKNKQNIRTKRLCPQLIFRLIVIFFDIRISRSGPPRKVTGNAVSFRQCVRCR